MLAGIALVLVGMCSVSHAGTLVVSTAADSGPGSLREAIIIAENNAEADEIVFTDDFLIVLEERLPEIRTVVVIRGNGWDRTIIDGNGTERAFGISSRGALLLDAVMITNCNTDPGVGPGAVTNGGLLRVTNSRLQRNEAQYGGAIGNGGTANLVGVELLHNHARGFGGAIRSRAGALSLQGCTLASNTTGGPGAAIWTRSTTRLERCSIVDNQAGSFAAISATRRVIQLVGCTIAGNTSSGPVVRVESGALTNCTVVDNSAGLLWQGELSIANTTITGNGTGIVVDPDSSGGISHSIIAGNHESNCTGIPPPSAGNNLEDRDDCGLTGTGDIVNTDPLLGPLGDNGGPTLTMMPAWSSPVLDAGSPEGCTWDHDGDHRTSQVSLVRDQRGTSRPLDGNSDLVAVCDIGAVESGYLFRDGFESGDSSRWGVVEP